MWSRRFRAELLGLVCLTWPAAAVAETAWQMPELKVIGVTPVLGTGIDKDRVPANVRIVEPSPSTGQGSVADMLNDRVGSVSVTDYQSNPLQPSLSFRGFTASPTLGEPQGLAVYQNGMRINEAFGDLVNWDLVPSFAVGSVQMMPGANPIFGLNALGGALALRMKDGFSNPGTAVEVAVGSFGRAHTGAEWGRQFGQFAAYAGVGLDTDDGWRNRSPSRLARSYADLAYRRDDLDLGLGITTAGSDLSGLAAAPVELLRQSRGAVYTGPDSTDNGLVALDLRAAWQLSEATAIQGGGYYRHLRSTTPNGNASGFGPCPGAARQICDGQGTPLTDVAGAPLTAATPAGGVVNASLTTSDGMGLSAQVSRDSPLFGQRNSVIAGTAVDRGWTDYQATTRTGTLSADRFVLADGTALGGNDYRVALGAQNHYAGVYITDTLALGERLDITAAGRFNTAALRLHDQLGSGLDGDHHFQRFNPSLGATVRLGGGVVAYASYSEANRVPTAAELSCADPAQPCRVPNAFVADPPLRQVVSHTGEIGTRGTHPLGEESKLAWTLAGYLARNDDDIIFISSGANTGSGYFANAGTTRRQGIEANIDLASGPWTVFADYGLVRA
ncbi:MAG TPA: TonB-dependent receptor, partial [Rhodospirillaceae bacterium]|nr:TonB-dependent receptor [Rhodospirillaceae bacterium]